MSDSHHGASPDEILLAKSRIREASRAARSDMHESERRIASRAIAHTVLGLWELDRARVVLSYVATAAEADPHLIVDALRVRGIRVALPRVAEPTGMSLHAFDEDSQLVVGSFGVLEPDWRAAHIQPHEVDAAIVPGVAFDAQGNRLGYGGGFYDRLLPHLRGECPVIGLAFDEQVVDEIPTQPHDVPVDLVVTQSTVHRRPLPETEVQQTDDAFAPEEDI